jgi:hypothetical protein
MSVTAGVIIDPSSCDTQTDVREGVLYRWCKVVGMAFRTGL